MRNYRRLMVWQKSHQLARVIYSITAEFPPSERYTLASQMRRSAASIPSNIAEGAGRGGTAELRRFIAIAAGSASELDYQLLLSSELGFIQHDEQLALGLVSEVKRMLYAFAAALTPGPGS